MRVHASPSPALQSCRYAAFIGDRDLQTRPYVCDLFKIPEVIGRPEGRPEVIWNPAMTSSPVMSRNGHAWKVFAENKVQVLTERPAMS